MDCEQVRGRFSSLWEKELTPPEEKNVRDHLSSCPKCQEEWKRFEKTMQWLYSVGEVEVPEGFLPELYEKMEGRKNKVILAEKTERRGFHLPLSIKLSAQAVAMVAIIFLVLYLTQMMPIDGYRPMDSKETSSLPFPEKKSEHVLAQEEVQKEKRGEGISSEPTRLKDTEQPKVPLSGKRKLEETNVSQVRVEAPSSKTEITGNQTIDSKEGVKEIVLRISDRGKVISQLHELVERFGGEMVTAEPNRLLASLPMNSFSDFEKELIRMSDDDKSDEVTAKEAITRSLRGAPERGSEEAGKKREGWSRPATDRENRTIVRILLIQE
jgi:hypothetical protein